MDSKLLSGDVAKILGWTPDYVRVLERTGQLHAVKTASGVRLFDRTDIERFARERANRIETRSARR
jgi:DNA-binding transcriptional MerR regulator